MRLSVCEQHKAKEQTTGMTVFLVILSVTDALICWWISFIKSSRVRMLFIHSKWCRWIDSLVIRVWLLCLSGILVRCLSRVWLPAWKT